MDILHKFSRSEKEKRLARKARLVQKDMPGQKGMSSLPSNTQM